MKPHEKDSGRLPLSQKISLKNVFVISEGDLNFEYEVLIEFHLMLKETLKHLNEAIQLKRPEKVLDTINRIYSTLSLFECDAKNVAESLRHDLEKGGKINKELFEKSRELLVLLVDTTEDVGRVLMLYDHYQNQHENGKML